MGSDRKDRAWVRLNLGKKNKDGMGVGTKA